VATGIEPVEDGLDHDFMTRLVVRIKSSWKYRVRGEGLPIPRVVAVGWGVLFSLKRRLLTFWPCSSRPSGKNTPPQAAAGASDHIGHDLLIRMTRCGWPLTYDRGGDVESLAHGRSLADASQLGN